MLMCMLMHLLCHSPGVLEEPIRRKGQEEGHLLRGKRVPVSTASTLQLQLADTRPGGSR